MSATLHLFQLQPPSIYTSEHRKGCVYVFPSPSGITMTSWWARWRLKSPASRVFIQGTAQSSASLALVRGIQRWPVNSPHKGPVTRKMFPFDDVITVVCRGCFRSTITLCPTWLARYVLFVKSTETELQQGPLRREPCASFLNLCHYIYWVLTFIAWWWPGHRGPQAINTHSDNSKLSPPATSNHINQCQTVYSTAIAHLSCAIF